MELSIVHGVGGGSAVADILQFIAAKVNVGAVDNGYVGACAAAEGGIAGGFQVFRVHGIGINRICIKLEAMLFCLPRATEFVALTAERKPIVVEFSFATEKGIVADSISPAPSTIDELAVALDNAPIAIEAPFRRCI